MADMPRQFQGTKNTDGSLSVTPAEPVDLSKRNMVKFNKTNPVHMELIRSAKGVIVVELAARGAGFQVFTKILPYVTGIDTVELQIKMALGETIKINSIKQLKGASIRFISPKVGELKSVMGIEDAKSVAGVQEVLIYIKPGDKMRELKSGSDRIGHLIVFADNRIEAERQSQKAHELIKIELK